MTHFTHDERMLMAIYNPGTKSGLVQELLEMKEHLTAEERDLIALTESVLSKLKGLDDEAYSNLDLFPEM